MPVESALLAHAADLIAPLFVYGVGDGDTAQRLAAGGADGRSFAGYSVRRAEALTLLSLCDETLWNDYGLLPTLRDDMLGPELASAAHLVLRRDGEELREIRTKALDASERLKKPSSEENDTPFDVAGAIADDGFQKFATEKYFAALESCLAPITIPTALRKRISENWLDRFGAGLLSVLNSEADRANAFGLMPTKASAEIQAEQKRLAELQRQSWRLDEVLARLDKWVRANPENVPTSSQASSPVPASQKRGLVFVGIIVAGLLGGLAVSWWAASSDTGRSLLVRVRVAELRGLPERLTRAAAWLGDDPIPGDVFTSESSLLQDSATSAPIADADLNRSFAELQQSRVVHAMLNGWVFDPVARNRFRTWDAQGVDWWNRSAALVIKAAPEENDPDAVERWRNLLPHLVALFESGKGKPEVQETFQSLLEAITDALLATRIDPGQKPAVAPESEALSKTLSTFVDSATKHLEAESKNLEVKYGRFSPELVTVHRLLAEFYWRTRESKKEQDSFVRAIRVLEKIEPRDDAQIAFLNLRLGMSRALYGDPDGAEEAFAAALQALRDRHGDLHPEMTRMQRQIARVYAGLGQFKLAADYFEKAIEGSTKLYPGPSPDIAAIYEEQGQFLLDYGQFASGVAAMQKGIEVLQKIEYATSPRLAQAHRSLADAQVLARQTDDAEKSARKAVELLRNEYGSHASQVGEAEVDWVSILLDVGDPVHAEEAGKVLETRITIPLNAPFPDDPETALLRGGYARSLEARGNAGEAVSQFERAIPVLLETQIRPSLAVALSLRDFGQALADSARTSDARKRLASAEAEVVELNKSRPRYTRVASRLLDDIRERQQKLK